MLVFLYSSDRGKDRPYRCRKEVGFKIQTVCKLIENASSDNVKLSTKTYLKLYHLYNVNFVKSKWIENVKNILVEYGLPCVWYNQYFVKW